MTDFNIVWETVEGSSAEDDIIAGSSLVRACTVSDMIITIPAGSYVQACDITRTAINYVKYFTGDEGSSYIRSGKLLYLQKFSAEVVGVDCARVFVHYKGFPNLQIEFNTSTSQVESNLDKDGTKITVSYTYPADYPGDPRRAALGKAHIADVQGGFISKPIAEKTLTVKYTVTKYNGVPAIKIINDWMDAYLNTVNDAVWSVAPGAARTWWCADAKATSSDGGLTYNFDITFHYRKETWDFLVTYINPDDGKPPKDLVDGTGYKKVQGIPTSTFPALPNVLIPA